MRRRIIDHDEPVDDARKWQAESAKYQAQALRLRNQLHRTVLEHRVEMNALQKTNRLLMEWNASLALDNSALSFALQQIRGDA